MPDKPPQPDQPDQPNEDGPDADSPSPVWNRPAPEIPDVLKEAPPPRKEPSVILKASKRRKRLSIVPQSSGSDMRAIGLGLDFGAMVGAGVLLGWGSDRVLGTSKGTIIGLVVGLVLASWHLYKGASKLNREFDDEASQRSSSKPSAPPTTIEPFMTRDTSDQSPLEQAKSDGPG